VAPAVVGRERAAYSHFEAAAVKKPPAVVQL
jgi:hypothetical protein